MTDHPLFELYRGPFEDLPLLAVELEDEDEPREDRPVRPADDGPSVDRL